MRQTIVLSIAVVFGMLGMSAPNKKDEEPQRIPFYEIGRKYLVMGNLGVPLGEEVEIRGKLRRVPKGGDSLLVSELNGQPLEKVVSVQIRGTTDWAEGTTATVRGHEEAEIDFLRELTSRSRDDAEFTPRQMADHFFVPTDVLEPAELKINMNKK